MPKKTMLAAFIIGLLVVMRQYPAEAVVQSVLTMYLIVAGFLIMVMRQSAWELLRPLFGIGIALLVLPPLFRDLVACAEQSLKYVFLYHINIGSEWLIAPVAALVIFVLFRVTRWYRARRPQNTRREVYRERERVLPPFDLNDDPRD